MYHETLAEINILNMKMDWDEINLLRDILFKYSHLEINL
jgi:hypothetical protein